MNLLRNIHQDLDACSLAGALHDRQPALDVLRRNYGPPTTSSGVCACPEPHHAFGDRTLLGDMSVSAKTVGWIESAAPRRPLAISDRLRRSAISAYRASVRDEARAQMSGTAVREVLGPAECDLRWRKAAYVRMHSML